MSLLSDNMARASGMIGLRPYHRPKPHGRHRGHGAYTRPATTLAIHRAFDFCRPGDVLVIDGAGELTQALMGEIMASFAESLGVQGLVIDGAIRDVGALGQRDFPCMHAASRIAVRTRTDRARSTCRSRVGGMVVHPGDIVVGDEDGVLAIPQTDAASGTRRGAQAG